MLKRRVTKRQKEILCAIYNSLQTDGYPPTFEKLKEILNINSNQAIKDHLNSLQLKGLIQKEEGTARGLVIKPLGYEAINRTPLVRIVGHSAAGPAIQAIEQNEWVNMPSGYQKYEDVFIIKISGNSMIDVGIYDGDSVLIKKEKQFKSGDIVLAQIGEDVTLKRFVFDNGRTYLKPENPGHRIIPITHDTTFLGKYITNLTKA